MDFGHLAWIHPTERTFLSALAYAGGNIGIIVMLVSSGFFAASPFGWPGIFYVSGLCGMVWVCALCGFGSNSPADCPRISACEKDFLSCNSIASRTVTSGGISAIPIRKILRSSPVWALLVANMAGGFAYNLFLTEIPTYINNILGFNIESVCT